MIWKIHIDTGGTFTDCIATDPDGRFHRMKILSHSSLRGQLEYLIDTCTYQFDMAIPVQKDIFKGYMFRYLDRSEETEIVSVDPVKKILKTSTPLKRNFGAFEIASPEEVPLFAARLFTATGLDEDLPPIHLRLGTTRGTNALLEKKGSPVALIVSRGFGDILAIGNQQRPNLFSLNILTKDPLYQEVLEIDSRMDAAGNILCPISQTELEKIASNLIHSPFPPGDISVAICLMHSYRNPEHEQQIKEFLTEKGFRHITCSSDISRSAKYLDRTETTVVNAYLKPIMDSYLSNLDKAVSAEFYLMTSAGLLTDRKNFHPKDSLLSGPAGGVTGAVAIARDEQEDQILSFDMGGTSTDVSLFSGDYSYTYFTRVGDARIQSAALSIDTIAAGGGSICTFDGKMLHVGPESAGAYPGPACYGAGGPLTITDVNLLSGRLIAEAFSIPIDAEAAQHALRAIGISGQTEIDLMHAFQVIANERMAETIRKVALQKGQDPGKATLVSFGGAGGQHACDISELLEIENILVPYDAGLLSAYGISTSEIARFSMQEIYMPLDSVRDELPDMINTIREVACNELLQLGHDKAEIYIRQTYCYIRFIGQETSIEVPYEAPEYLDEAFKKAYEALYGHWLESQQLELVSVKVIAAIAAESEQIASRTFETYRPEPFGYGKSLHDGEWLDSQHHIWEDLHPGAEIDGPAVVISNNNTVFVKKEWRFSLNERNTAKLSSHSIAKPSDKTLHESANIRLFLNRFSSVAEEMGAILERTSFSVNIKERFDFSCALLDRDCRLIVNAPHIPVHLGSLSMCVKAVSDKITMREGDIVVTNHPAYGGSHLPDVTLIAPVFHSGQLVGYVANRAHHAEIGGKSPGSMPPHATRLIEEGVIIEPFKLVDNGIPQWEQVEHVLKSARFPSRSIDENLADLRGGVASIHSGITGIGTLCKNFGVDQVLHYMAALTDYVAGKFRIKRHELPFNTYGAEEFLDDGQRLVVTIRHSEDKMSFDFTGTGPRHTGNLNATPAIVNSVVLYVLRLLLDEDLPLNDGLLEDVEICIPECLLNPDLSGSMEELPAVVGGNTEVSQRLTDTILKAFEMAACSQGTMNNLIFGNERFGFYETICGGTGAGDGYHGHDAIHQHMTNTRITDPEIMELRYPVMVEEFSIRRGSGGQGRWHGGDGVIRKIRFLENVLVSILAQHRKEQPYGLQGGMPGKTGAQQIRKSDGRILSLVGNDQVECTKGDTVEIFTPGGGGFGYPG
ncbi:hydantoinase B/oxoprolinase family protein [Fulvivirga sedimenti]|uniref:Hydantoinase B/oxoprolinase family protein n=1 Tax=Fulvivirga sedimenti TaxID=2879465 RepID=A0A9X1KXQ4_9BACT|nr:hydantoinase B/oxoprolinase family protein [Fulvivirga sedimenti]MCA6074417.1 hydantoinase B/oxoprolinase family protein [Fulvivirga sedimenti]